MDRAVQTVEEALELNGAPVYVRKEIVHNQHVVRTLEERGAIFVDETDEVPEGALVIFSAHGVAPIVHQEAAARNLRTIDATCPLVTKVHNEARRFAEDGVEGPPLDTCKCHSRAPSINSRTKVGRATPVAAQSIGYMLWLVKPGRVLISLSQSSPLASL